MSSDGQQPIWPQRLSKRRKIAYLDFTRIAQSLPDVRTDTVRKLAEMAVLKPSNVPKASTAQIAEFLRIAEEDNLRGKRSITDLKEDTAQLE